MAFDRKDYGMNIEMRYLGKQILNEVALPSKGDF
jgi:hypothetical protein